MKTFFNTFIVLFIIPITSFAFFCPTNFSQIEIGATVAQVVAACGKPDVEETKEVKDDSGPQEWSYFVPQTVATQTSMQAQGTLKTQIALDASGKVLNISVNGIGVGSTTICGNPVSLGDSKETVKAACGKPTFVNKGQGDVANENTLQQPGKKMTTYLYKSNPPIKLIFENGVLVGKQ